MSHSPRFQRRDDAAPRRTTVSSTLLHDLRSPLSQIIGYSEMLAEEATDSPREDLATDLGKISAAGRRILALIEQNFRSDSHARKLSSPRLAETAAVAAAPLRGLAQVTPGRLLVVDDDPDNRDVLSRSLERHGHQVDTANDGQTALKLMRETSFDLVLLDILMPDLDGYEVLSEIKRATPLQHIPVIMISALNEVQSVVRCIEAGADDYLAKPFDATLLQARIGASLERKRGRDREALLYDELQRNFTRLQEVERLRDDMRNMIVHDLRTPLTGVIVGVEMLEKHGDLNPAQREMMTIATSSGRTLLAMINDLLDVEKMESRKTELNYETLSASILVSESVAQLVSLAQESGTEIICDVPPGLPPFEGDRGKLGRTLVNLAANALKFASGGKVTITATAEAEAIRFSIRDTGQGIPPESFGRIFEKFGQLDTRITGTGLGLAFCKLAVEAHGGTISVQSTIGAGSEFSFLLPLRRTEDGQD